MTATKKLVTEPVDKKLSPGDVVVFTHRGNDALDGTLSSTFWYNDYNNGEVTLVLRKSKTMWSVRAADGMVFYAFEDEFDLGEESV